MRIAFLGAAQTVTGSQHLIQVNGSTVLLDCGLYQGRGREAFEHNHQFDFDPKKLSAVILSHAHIDHSGNLPNLVRQGYEGPIFATQPTAHLADIMLRDSAHIQEVEAESGSNGHGKSKWTPPEPLYTIEDAAKVAPFFQVKAYNQAFEAAPGVTVRLVEAGHILGSAAVALEMEEKGKKHRLWFSGDIGRRNLPLIKDPVLPMEGETLVMECTYGDKQHGDPLEALEELGQVLKRTLERGGKVIVPAFAVGRTQELVYCIHQLIEQGDLPQVPVFVDSPLAVEASQVFTNHPEFFDEEAQNFLKEDKNREALGFDSLTYISDAEESRALRERDDPMIIISASGMLENGRVVHHVRNSIGDPRCTILIVSYQAPNTLGRALLNGDERVEIFGEMYPVKAEVARVSGFSAHAGQRLLLEYAEALKGKVKQIFLVHGESDPAEVLREKMREGGLEKIYYPFLRQSMEI